MYPLSESERSPIATLVLFIFMLSLVWGIFAGVHYYAVDLPEQKSIAAPSNNGYNVVSDCQVCVTNCWGRSDYNNCIATCDPIC